jgi:fructose-1,6-bisphosphatase/sedoheptulose 1,7-bisphosphatase-like protein
MMRARKNALPKWALRISPKNTKCHEMASGDVVLSATGVTSGSMLSGIAPKRRDLD